MDEKIDIVIMPYGPDLETRGNEIKVVPSVPTEVITRYVAHLCKTKYKGQKYHIWLVGERTWEKSPINTNDLMKEILLQCGIPEQNIKILGTANNTVQQVYLMAQHKNWNNLTIMALSFHALRIRFIMWWFGLKGKIIKVTFKDLIGIKEEISNIIPMEDLQKGLAEFEIIEMPLRIEALFDPRGSFISWYSEKRVGSRITNFKRRKNKGDKVLFSIYAKDHPLAKYL